MRRSLAVASRVAIGIFAFILPAAPLSAAVLDIAPEGSGIYQDIAHALSAAHAGDTLRLADGVYTGAGNRNNPIGGAITILSRSGDPEQCVIEIEGAGRAFLIYAFPGTDVRVEGITIRGGDPGSLPQEMLPGYGGGVAVKVLSPGGIARFDRCVFEGNRAEVGGGAFFQQASGVFTECVFRANIATDGAGVYCGYCNGAQRVDFARSLFHENDYPYPQVGGYGAGVYYSHSRGAVSNCTFAGNRAWFGAGALISTDSAVDVDGSIFAFSTEGQGLGVFNGSFTIARTDIYGNAGGDWVGAIAGEVGSDCNFSADPLFCDAPAGDFTLREDSPCLPENSGGCGWIGALPLGCAAPTSFVEEGAAAGGGAEDAAPRLEVLPNPAGAAAEARFRVIAPGAARVTLHDAAGRRVASLFEREVDAGLHRIEISTRLDESGRPLPPGIYFVRVDAPGATAVRRLVVAK